MTSWKAARGTQMNVVVSGLVALTSRSVETKTEKEPRAPQKSMNQKKGTSRKGMLRRMYGTSPLRRTSGVSRRRERRDV
jgi:hypothetical protein